mmetsp:Transcript_45641/g.74414  ORF Transcript_45641/g.74414 Transcript_45641/m.74414 type:complete len:266 (+) Transcript_45641:64-861(+)|eukprot:CAMPEP_0184334616 /NCGR_PEP_ID=MMETSP1089-20130417/3342_1 /TAXON_ID=38269 ORGANISM="Gloeochaete wittrockiana, Strain SAG46.84" /NCGR_SAMPLE_ID=MMETSP1089 /ASSEMBLY_ACC=CAM_ASM_000445 /LENGTH=265 /DNA_ID=CAMNT_0026658929 /DNA_START=48 /DNA_END=845 /DNA_ORIENTATION=+
MHFVLVTGASQGFGQALCVELAKVLKTADFALVARGAEGLKKTAALIRPLLSNESTVHSYAVDLGDLDHIESSVGEVLTQVVPSKYERAFLINNAGMIGEQVDVRDYSLKSLKLNVDFSITSTIYLTAQFISKFAPVAKNVSSAGSKKTTVVNVSSLAALQPFNSWGQYCLCKAARDMAHRSIASEEKELGSGVRTLSYAPGPMDTAMTQAVRESDAPLSKVFKDMHTNGKMVDTYGSARKLAGLLLKDEFESGAHIDFFDVPDM